MQYRCALTVQQVIVESAASFGVAPHKQSSPTPKQRSHLLLFTAKSDKSLQDSIKKHSDYLTHTQESRIQDMAYTLATRRQFHEHRAFAVSDGTEPLVPDGIGRTKGSARSLIYVFTGQGAQWAEMGRTLIEDHPSFRADLETMDSMLASSSPPPSWSIIGTVDLRPIY